MTDFDQLIKEKANSAQYKFKASSWKQYASQAGFKVGLSGLQIALVSLALVAVVGGAIFFFTNHTNTPAPVPSQETLAPATCDTTNAQTLDTIAENPQSTQPHATARPVPSTEPVTPAPEDDTQLKVLKKDRTTKRNHDVYHPIRINVDTITDIVPTDEQLKRCNSNL